MANETDIAFEYLEKIYRPAWREANPDADKRICPSPSSQEWVDIAKAQLAFWQAVADKTSILNQCLADDCAAEGVIICPECQRNISDFYGLRSSDADMIDRGLCPICNCPGVLEYNEGEFTEKCDSCSMYDDCLDDIRREEIYAEERQRELIRYQCRGDGAWPPPGIGEYSLMCIGR